MAKRDQKPVYINDDLFGSTFRRNHEGDYRCTRLQVKTMLRDQAENTMDMEVLDDIPMEDLNYETIQGSRNKPLMKMFNLISIGERSGSGVLNIFNTWADEGWKEPVIEERFDPDCTILTLEFVENKRRK